MTRAKNPLIFHRNGVNVPNLVKEASVGEVRTLEAMRSSSLQEPLELVLRMLTGGLAAAHETTIDIGMVRSFVCDDAVFHVHSGVEEFSGDYHGLDDVVANYLNRMMTSNVKATTDLQTISSNDEFVVTLGSSTLTRPDDRNHTWSIASVSRLRENKVAEVWLISSSMNEPLTAREFWLDVLPLNGSPPAGT